MKPPKVTRRAEGRGQPQGNLPEIARVRTQSRAALLPHLERVHEAARRDRRARFTALLHHVTVEALDRAFHRLKRRAAPGVDGETVTSYEQGLAAKLGDLHARVQTGRYRPHPVRRVYIPKADGGQRPLGIPALEDKIVQSAVAEVLSALYEADFVGFSYGFRPGRSPHQALTALHTALMSQCVNWVLDADIRRFFDSVDHERLLRVLAERVADPRILRLVRRWLRAGVLEGTEWHETEQGTPQGAGISPLLANIFLHSVLDRWIHAWRQRETRGRLSIVRYADDFIMGCQYEADARRVWAALQERLAQFGLTLHEGKTRLIEFGRFPAERRRRGGERRPETFAFLGFTHYCGWTRDGRFVVKRRTEGRRLTRKLHELRAELWRRMHAPVAMQHARLVGVLRGHYAYYGLPSNWHRLDSFYDAVRRCWYRVLRRRSQRSLTWAGFTALEARFPLPPPRITHPLTPLVTCLGTP